MFSKSPHINEDPENNIMLDSSYDFDQLNGFPFLNFKFKV